MPLEAIDISYAHPGASDLFTGVSLRVESGEVAGLTGRSGAGKTTMARILAGHLRPRVGHVMVDGRLATSRGRRAVQMVYQHAERAIDPRWRMERVLAESWEPPRETLDELGIERGWLGRYSSELSGGELQRFCVARALSPETRYLVADEMTTMLDAVLQAQLWHAVLRRVKEDGLGVLVVSHDRPLLERLCDRYLEL